MKKFLLHGLLFSVVLLLCGCEGFSQLPEIDFTGMTKPEVVEVFATQAPLAWGTDIHLSVPTKKSDLYTNNNLYFKTIEAALAHELVIKATRLGGFYIDRPLSCPGGTDYYVVVFGVDGRVEKQEKHSYFDAL